MPFRIMTPPPQQKPQMTARSSPSFSNYGQSPTPCTTDDLVTAKCEKHLKYLHWLRIAATTVTLGVSTAVTACAGVSLRAYSQSNLGPDWLLPLWPSNMDFRPTYAVLACGILITIFSLSYLVLAFVPMVSLQFPWDIHTCITDIMYSRASYTTSISHPPFSPSSAL